MLELGIVARACNIRTWGNETWLQAGGYPELHSEFQASLGYLVRPHL